MLEFDPVAEIGLMPHEELVDYYSRTWRSIQDFTPTAVVPGGYYNTIFSWSVCFAYRPNSARRTDSCQCSFNANATPTVMAPRI